MITLNRRLSVMILLKMIYMKYSGVYLTPWLYLHQSLPV